MTDISMLALAIKQHPCKKVMNRYSVVPECIDGEYGTCEVFPKAIYCPKYGLKVGLYEHNGFVRFEKVDE